MRFLVSLMISIAVSTALYAEIGDPQIRTDHPWYPGELAISNFERLFATQAEAYRREIGREVITDQDKAIASWYWRNTHYWHGEEGGRDLWGTGLGQGSDVRMREYWSGLFGSGFGLCGTTHSQWTAELDQLLGHGRSRGVGAAGHNALEVFLRGDGYGTDGNWALLDHDLSSVVFDDTGRRLLGLGEMQSNVDRWIDRTYKPERQQGWLVCGLHPGDGESYRQYAVAEYLAGYAGPPPMLNLRRGERMRRYFAPGLGDGKTYVYWGRNYNTASIPGPERSRTWVNQPEQMYHSTTGTRHHDGQVRFANVEYIYQPDFSSADYRESVVSENDREVTLEFQTPYVIAATPPNEKPWGIYDAGCQNGLRITSNMPRDVTLSTDAGRTWSPPQSMRNSIDLTDLVKGRSQYWIRFAGGARELVHAGIEIRTVCQANVAVLPRLKADGTVVEYATGGTTVQSFGPEADLASGFITDGGFGQPSVSFTIKPRRPAIAIYAAAHVASGNPPDPMTRYQIEFRSSNDSVWQPIVADWNVPRRGDEPADFWSQSLCYGTSDLNAKSGQPIELRFSNDSGKRYMRAEVHLVEQTGVPDAIKVTYNWTDDRGIQQASHIFAENGRWHLATGKNIQTHWVELETVPE